ncbi:MAG: hypothetical protein PUG48_00590 [Clostridia bacterium]|nr:hypothetical protein [Clostridia bacterium]
MSVFDEKISVIDKKIDKLNEEVKKKKAQITKLSAERKQLETDKNREYSEVFLKTIKEYGVDTEDERQALIDKIEEMLIGQKINEETTPHINNTNKN